MYNWSTTVLEATRRDVPPVLATIINHAGSAPRTAGARMLVLYDGPLHGTIGGGKYEALAMKKARAMQDAWLAALAASAPPPPTACTMNFSLHGIEDMDLICGGELSILLELLPQGGMLQAAFTAAAAAETRGEGYAFITRLTPCGNVETALPLHDAPVHTERHVYCYEATDAAPPKGIPHPVLSQIPSGKGTALLHCSDPSGVWIVEPFPSPHVVHIFGGGHVAKALTEAVHPLNFNAIILEDRPEFAEPERFPHALAHLLPALGQKETAAYLAVAHITPRHGIIIMTRGHAHDRDVLAAALTVPAGYVGMIGSRSKWRQVQQSLLDAGTSAEALARVATPIGLDIGADTPEEIAVSIAAELIAWRSGKKTWG